MSPSVAPLPGINISPARRDDLPAILALERAGFAIESADYGRLNVYADYVCIRRDVPYSNV